MTKLVWDQPVTKYYWPGEDHPRLVLGQDVFIFQPRSSMNEAQIRAKIEKTREQLKETRRALDGERSAARDALLVVIPMLEDQLELLEIVLTYISDPNR